MAALNGASATNWSEVARALEVVRSASDTSDVPPASHALLEKAMAELWERLRNTQAYHLNDHELALLNYFRRRYSTGSNDEIARRAITRYWDHKSASNDIGH